MEISNRLRLIGFSGYAGSGKDTSAAILKEDHGYTRFAFADELKREVYASFQFVRDLVDHYGWERAKRDFPEVRELLQEIGVSMRFRHGSDYWVNKVAAKIKTDSPERVAITDVRFPNEAKWIRDNGGIVVRIESVFAEAANGHESERVMDLAADEVVYNDIPDDLEPLRCQLDGVVYRYAKNYVSTR